MRKSFLALALFASVYFVAVRAPCSSEVVPVSRLSVAMTAVSHKQMSVFSGTTDRWHNRNFYLGRNSRGKSTGVRHSLDFLYFSNKTPRICSGSTSYN